MNIRCIYVYLLFVNSVLLLSPGDLSPDVLTIVSGSLKLKWSPVFLSSHGPSDYLSCALAFVWPILTFLQIPRTNLISTLYLSVFIFTAPGLDTKT
jgi:hypothetical protein